MSHELGGQYRQSPPMSAVCQDVGHELASTANPKSMSQKLTLPIILSVSNDLNLKIRKILVSVKFLSALLGPEMGASILWTPGKCVLSAGKKPMSIKFLILGGGGGFGVLGGGEWTVPILFLWARGFSDMTSISSGASGGSLHRGANFNADNRGPKKHINFFNINFLAPTQNAPLWTPRKKFMCLISWERTPKRDPRELFGGDFWVKNRRVSNAALANAALVL